MAAEDFLPRLVALLQSRHQQQASADSYASSLYRSGTDAILRKVMEEATELLLAVKSGRQQDIVHEAADLCFHSLLLLIEQGIDPRQICAELERRSGRSGVAEKASRLTPGSAPSSHKR